MPCLDAIAFDDREIMLSHISRLDEIADGISSLSREVVERYTCKTTFDSICDQGFEYSLNIRGLVILILGNDLPLRSACTSVAYCSERRKR